MNVHIPKSRYHIFTTGFNGGVGFVAGVTIADKNSRVVAELKQKVRAVIENKLEEIGAYEGR